MQSGRHRHQRARLGLAIEERRILQADQPSGRHAMAANSIGCADPRIRGGRETGAGRLGLAEWVADSIDMFCRLGSPHAIRLRLRPVLRDPNDDVHGIRPVTRGEVLRTIGASQRSWLPGNMSPSRSLCRQLYRSSSRALSICGGAVSRQALKRSERLSIGSPTTSPNLTTDSSSLEGQSFVCPSVTCRSRPNDWRSATSNFPLCAESGKPNNMPTLSDSRAAQFTLAPR
jgi:hypothetical protein